MRDSKTESQATVISKSKEIQKSIVLREKRKNVLRRNIIATLMASPPFIGFLAFTLVPMLISLGISFTELHSYNLSMAKYVGFSNYIEIFKLDLLWKSLGNTLYYCLSVPINLVLALLLSYILSKKLPGSRMARIIFFIPQVCSGVAVTLMWQWIFEENFGVINTALAALNLPKIHFMTDKNWFMPAVLVISLWQKGTNVVLFEAAFVNVDISLQEAARIDGATESQVFWKITLPALTPTIFYVWTMNLI
ncbi:MAG: carbohydrate ABC transporter permease, partial [Candidatus Scatosoma sp.]